MTTITIEYMIFLPSEKIEIDPKEYPFAMVLYNHKNPSAVEEDNITIIAVKHSGLLDVLYYSEYYPDYERVLSGKTESCLKL